jgi:type IV pilus assembly protein PilY1
MIPPRPSTLLMRLAAVAATALLALPAGVHAARPVLAETPLQSLNRVKPNIMFTVDDSGSMIFEFLPDYTAEGPPPLNGGVYYCRDRRNCGGIVDPLNGPSWAIDKYDPPIRSSAYNRLFYDPSVDYTAGKKADSTYLSCEASSANCTGPWTNVYADGFAGYPGANSGSTINLTNGYPDTVWCNSQSQATGADFDTAFTDGSRCRINGRSYKSYTAFSGASILWTAPAVAAGYNYPNAINPATGSATTCAGANEYCVFNIPAGRTTNPYYYTVSKVQFCQFRDAGGFGTPPCSDRWDETTYRYVRYGSDPNKAFDPAAFTRIDIVPPGVSANGVPGPAVLANGVATINPSGRTVATEMANFAKWYSFHRNRILAMKTAGGIAFSALTDENARVGLHTLRFGWNGSTGTYIPNGNMNNNPFLNIADFNPANKSTWFTSFYGLKMGGGTPLPDAMYRIGEYFSNSGNSGLPGAVDPLDPVTGRCQQNYHLMSTDGYWNFNLRNASVGDQDRTVPGTLPGPVPGFTPGSPFPRPYYEGSNSSSNNLADLAMYYWIRDLRPAIPDNVKDTLAPWQHVNFYALAIGAQGSIVYPTGIDAITAGLSDWPVPLGAERSDSIDDLWHAAINGRGRFFNPSNSQQLGESIVAALADFTSQSGTGTAIGIAGAQLTATRSYGYRASYEIGSWGDVKKYALDPATGALPVKADGNPLNAPVWSAATQLDAQAAVVGDVKGWDTKRKILTMKDDGQPVAFRIGNLSGKQKDALNKGWTAAGVSVTADAVLNYLRGDQSNEGDGTTNFRVRSHILGDIVYSGAVPVGAPGQPYDDTGNPGYPAFAAAKSTRTPMVYVGANDGMLHAFVDSSTTDGGKEAWAYVPNALFSATDPNNPGNPTDAASRAFQLGALSYRRGGIPLFDPKF